MVARHIGIAAVSSEGAALCYREVLRVASRSMPPEAYPRVTVHNEPMGKYVRAVQEEDWETVGDLLAKSARHLAATGAEVVMCPDNAVLHGVHIAEGGSPIPWLKTAEVVADAIAASEQTCVGIIGTRMVTTGSAFQTALGVRGVRLLAPEDAEVDRLDEIIFGELVFGRATASSQQEVLGMIERLRSRGCEGVVLGCSEAPLMVTPENAPAPIYDTTTILVEAALRWSSD
ncbi:MAG: aspartate/glutamate racemase family protein [Planctomycetota bacterium]